MGREVERPWAGRRAPFRVSAIRERAALGWTRRTRDNRALLRARRTQPRQGRNILAWGESPGI